MERAQGVVATGVAQGGQGKGGGIKGATGCNLYFNEVFNKTT